MESFTHESEDSSSCTQSDGDSTNSSNGTNPFLLCPRGDSLHSAGHGRLHDSAEDIRPYKLARVEASGQLRYHASGLTNSQGGSTIPYAHNVVGEIYGSDGIHRSALLSQGRSYASSALEDCRDLPPDFASAGRFQQAALPYIGAAQNYFAQDQWSGLRQQAYVLKPVAPGNTPASTLLLPMSCKVGKMPINFASNAGDFYLGLTDPQPGRCRRTDGKKWRCGRAVVPEQKYCERHMHRGRGRSKAAKLAKITTTVDTNQPHGSGRPLNQPLVQLLSQLTVPIQPVDQPLETGQLPKGAFQPLNWLQKSAAQTFQHPHTHLPYASQPLLADQPSQFPIQSKPLDWPITQSPMQAEPLHVGQSNGRPAVLAQAIPMNVVSDVKISPDCGSGLTINEASRKRTDDPNDVLNLDVQGIKRLLENAPCNQRSASFGGKQKQLPNVADLLNVAHIGNSNFEPRKPPSLLDVLKMVDPFTSSSMRTSTSPACHHPLSTPQASPFLPANICQPGQDLPETGQSGTHLSLTLSDEQTSEKQNKQCLSNLPSSLDSVTMQMHNGVMPVKLFKATYEGWLNSQTQGDYLHPLARNAMEVPLPDSTEACASQPGNQTCHTSETTNSRQSELLLVERSKNSDGTLINSEKTCLNLMEERRHRAAQLIKGIASAEDGDSKSEAGTNGQKGSTNLDINSSTQADGQFKYPRSLVQENSSTSRKVNSNHHEYSPKSNSGSLILLEGSLGACDSSGKSEGFFPRLTEKIPDQHIGADSSDINSLVLVKKRSIPYESYVNLDINIPILTVKDGRQPGNSDLEKASPSSTPPIENLQTKAPLDRSFSGSSSNASSLSKSTLSLDPVALSNPELSPHVSLAN